MSTDRTVAGTCNRCNCNVVKYYLGLWNGLGGFLSGYILEII